MMNEWIISSSALIAGVLAVRFALRGRISLRLQYALWAVVLVRLLIPFQLFTSDFGTGAVAQDVNLVSPVRQVYTSARSDEFQAEYDAAYLQVVAEYEANDRTIVPDIIDKEAYSRVQENRALDLSRLLYHIWFLGMTVMAAVIVSCNLHLALRLRRSRRVLDIPDSLLPVYVTAAVPTPCVFGLFRPAIYLTPGAAEDETVLRHALTHELTHYRHLDHVWSVLRSLCLVLHWYNPLVWLAAKVSRADGELACDEGALRVLGESQRGDYGRTLIGLTCGVRLGSLFLNATTMTGSAGSLRERIRLLMKRPKTTMLTLTALILVVTVIVGCTFSAAPATEQPDITPTPPAETTAPTGHVPDNDMAYEGQELPIPEEPAALFNDKGLLIYPGFDWLLTEEEVLSRLGLTPEDCLEYEKTSGDGMWANSFTVRSADAFGVPMELCFTFRSFWEDVEPVLTEVYGDFENHGDFEAVRALYTQVLGETDHQNTPGIEESWYSEATFRELLGSLLGDRLTTDPQILVLPASWVSWCDSGSRPGISWHTELPLPADPVAEVTALFSEFADPVHRAALLELYDYSDMETKPFTTEELFLPEITEVVLERSDDAVVYYHRPGDFRRYAAKVFYSEEDGWYVFSNRIVVSMEDHAHLNPRALTEKELQKFRSHFNTLNTDGAVNPAACFLLPYYKEIYEMDGRAFLAYFPTEQEGTKEDFDLLKEKYPDFFGDWTYETMPIPIHRYSAREIEQVVSRYGNIHWQELDNNVHYLEETGCYYNYTSDFGLGGFRALGGFVYDGGAVVYSDFSALFFTETAGSYTIRAHLPAIIAER